MIALLQRVSEARVDIAGETVGAIGPGLLVLVCAEPTDTDAVGLKLLQKILKLRIFGDEAGQMNRSLLETGGELLVVSQFTLYGDARRGRRPSFTAAAPPEEANRLYRRFVEKAAAAGVTVREGVFRALMDVHLVNSGPVTVLLDSAKAF